MRILYICTHNRCRSIMAEAITNQLGEGRLLAASAGSQPAGQVHPDSLRYLQQAGYATKGLHSKSWQEMSGFDADLLITLCDSANQEACPLWLGDTLKVHWGLSDPSLEQGGEAATAAAFAATISQLQARVQALLALDKEALAPAQLRVAMLGLVNV